MIHSKKFAGIERVIEHKVQFSQNKQRQMYRDVALEMQIDHTPECVYMAKYF